jgi:hypothetical protein
MIEESDRRVSRVLVSGVSPLASCPFGCVNDIWPKPERRLAGSVKGKDATKFAPLQAFAGIAAASKVVNLDLQGDRTLAALALLICAFTIGGAMAGIEEKK